MLFTHHVLGILPLANSEHLNFKLTVAYRTPRDRQILKMYNIWIELEFSFIKTLNRGMIQRKRQKTYVSNNTWAESM